MVGEVARGTGADVGIISGNCRPILNPSRGIDCLGKREVGIEIGVFIVDAVPSPKTGVHVELHEVCEPVLS